HRGTQGRIRRVSGFGRVEQTLSLQDPRAELLASAGHGFPVQGSHACRRAVCPWLDRRRFRGDRPVSYRRLCDHQPSSFAFTPENKSWAEKEVQKYPPGRQASAVLALLWRGHEQEGRVSKAMIEA